MAPQDYSKANESKHMSMTVKVDGVPYRFEMGEISAKIELELYNQSGGLRLTKVLQEVVDGPTGFHVAAIVFLARRAQGDQITFDEVADNMGLASDLEIVMDEQEGTDLPEVSAAS